MEDRFLIEQTLAGSESAFRLLVLRYQRPLFRFLSQYRLADAVSEELAQETFLRAFRALRTFDPERGTRFSSWLFQIASHLALNEKGRARHRHETADEAAAAGVADPAPDPSGRLEAGQTAKGIAAVLAAIPEDLRRVITLACIEELSLEEISALEARPVGTIKSRIFRGKQLLRALLLQSKGVQKNGL